MAFHFEFLKSMVPDLAKVALDMINRLKTRDDLSKIDSLQEFSRITGDEIGRIFFGEEFSKDTINGQDLTPFVCKITRRLIDMEFLTPYYFMFGIKFLESGIFYKHREHNKEVKEL